MIRILLADDSLAVRKEVGRILARVAGIAIAGEADNGLSAVAANQKLRPDVIIMDIAMPVMSGPEAVAQIMATRPCPIVILSSFQNLGEKFKTWDALSAGAVARIEKTEIEKNPEKWQGNLIRTVQAAARIKVRARQPTAAKKIEQRIEKVRLPNGHGPGHRHNIVAVGGSTGSIGVILKMLQTLPADFPLPVLLIIHLSETQDSAFAQWLAGYSRLDVAFAGGGEKLDEQGGRVLLAPAGRHMVAQDGRIALAASEPLNFCRPSIDVLFHSLALDHRLHPIAILLTGIGRDGACGLAALKDAGGYTICQDESTAIVFGMPKAAIDMGAACAVLPDEQLVPTIMALTKPPSATGG